MEILKPGAKEYTCVAPFTQNSRTGKIIYGGRSQNNDALRTGDEEVVTG